MHCYKFSLKIKNDNNNAPMFAYITIIPPLPSQPKTPFNANDIKNFLEQNGIIFGIKEEVINELVNKKEGKEVLIAEGIAPVHGKDAQFESLVSFPLYDTIIPPDLIGTSINKDDEIIPIVSKGTPILKKIPPTKGVNGKDIYGKEIKAYDGKDITLYKGKNTVFLRSDRNILIADADGYPLIEGNTASIEKVYIIREDVKVANNNINFDGIIVIYGSVPDGVRITASSDVIVMGKVEGALIDSGRNVLICGGITGKDMAAIKTKGSINAKFVEMATLEAGDEIIVDDLIQSFGFALNKITADKIVGGEVRSTSLIETNVAGLPTGDTVLCVGPNPYLDTQIEEINQELINKRELLKTSTAELSKLLFEPKNDEINIKIEKLRELIPSLEIEIQKLCLRKQKLDKFLSEIKDACIIVRSKTYAGVEVNIGEHSIKVQDEINEAVKFTLGKHGIVTVPISTE